MHTTSRRHLASFLSTAVVAVALTWSPPAAAQYGNFGGLNWTFVDPGNASGTVGGGELQVIGPDGAGGTCFHGVAAYFETVAPLSGTVSVTLDWTSIDLCHYDWPVYVLDGAATVIPTSGDNLGCFPANVLQVEFDVVAGQAIGLGVGSADCFKGPGIATWTGFSLLPDEWIDLGQALDPRLEFEIVDAGANVDLGTNVAAIGDVNGDGVSEFMVTAAQGFTGSKVSLHRGTTGGQLWSVSSSSNLGNAYAAPGDVDGDGDPDVAVGTYAESQVDILSGADGSVIWSWTWGGSSLDYYAGSLAVHADVDGDGILDVAVGTNHSPSLSVRVLSGADGSLLREILPSPGDDRFGGSLGDMGDLDGDGITDLAVRASATPPIVRVYSGDDASVLLEIDATDGLPAINNGFNAARLVGLPDIDGDTVRDLAVGAPLSSVSFNDFSGSVALYSGATGDQLWQVDGPGVGARLGSALDAVDIDDDGIPELAAGAYGHELVAGQFEDNGLVWILDASDGTPRLQMEGPPGGGSLGLGLATLTGAAQPTILVGIPEDPEGSRVQAVADLTHVHGAPRLRMFGPLVSDTPWMLRISDGAGSLPVGLVLGLSPIDAPLFGGVLVPDATWVFWAQLDPAGRLLLQGTWPPGVELAPPLWLQAWIPDPAGPQGWSATNARRSP